jgi:hypothetical protein
VSDSSETRYATARLRHAAMRVLAQETSGDPATSENLAAASARLLETLSKRLGQVIGPAGVQAIFLRAVTLRKSEFAFLDERMVARDDRDGVAESLRTGLKGQKPDVIRDVAVALFATFAGLLANVIGDRLTWSLLQQIWPDTLRALHDSQETDE